MPEDQQVTVTLPREDWLKLISSAYTALDLMAERQQAEAVLDVVERQVAAGGRDGA